MTWQVLLVPSLRVPMLLNFFAAPNRTAALSQPALQRVLDAALFEPGTSHAAHAPTHPSTSLPPSLSLVRHTPLTHLPIPPPPCRPL
jgi:hypothetical protein